jgi:hypothetical protein
LLPPLRGSKELYWPAFRGLTPTAICCHRFAIPEKAQLQNWRFGLALFANGNAFQTIPLPND